MKPLITLLTLVFFSFSFSQRIISQEFYEGKIDGKNEISLYFKVQENGCPTTEINAIYKYKSNKTGEWILLDVFFNEGENQYTLVEHFNTGILLLKKENGTLKGLWISPEGKKQLKVELKKVKVSKSEIENLENALEKENYEANDC